MGWPKNSFLSKSMYYQLFSKEKLILRCFKEKLGQKIKNHTNPACFRKRDISRFCQDFVNFGAYSDFKWLERLCKYFFISGLSFSVISLWIDKIWILNTEEEKNLLKKNFLGPKMAQFGPKKGPKNTKFTEKYTFLHVKPKFWGRDTRVS